MGVILLKKQMAEFDYNENEIIEDFLGMKSGYVLDFSNRTFHDFVNKSVKRNIYDEVYHYASNSKANLLRKFFQVESSATIAKLLEDLVNYWITKVQRGQINHSKEDEYLHSEFLKIIEKLKSDKLVENIEAIKPNDNEDKDFEKLAINIKESIENNEPELAIDRLHTFVFKYIRTLCKKHQIEFKKEESLNSVFGKYVKYLSFNNLLDSEMSEKILKYSIII